MKKKIIFATGNQNKMREIRQILDGLDVEIRSMKEAEISCDIVEDGETFEDNAMIKAKEVAKYTDAIVVADDSGLEIDYLNKEPGVYSARYMGEDTSYEIKNQALLDRLKGVPKDSVPRVFYVQSLLFFQTEKPVSDVKRLKDISVKNQREKMVLDMILFSI